MWKFDERLEKNCKYPLRIFLKAVIYKVGIGGKELPNANESNQFAFGNFYRRCGE